LKRRNKRAADRTEQFVLERSSSNYAVHEFIGMEVEVVSPALKQGKVCGRIIEETKNMLLLDSNGQAVYVQKNGAVMLFSDQGYRWEIKLEDVAYRPYERPKKIKNARKVVSKVVDDGRTE